MYTVNCALESLMFIYLFFTSNYNLFDKFVRSKWINNKLEFLQQRKLSPLWTQRLTIKSSYARVLKILVEWHETCRQAEIFWKMFCRLPRYGMSTQTQIREAFFARKREKTKACAWILSSRSFLFLSRCGH